MPTKKICCIFNYAPHYREPIFSLMDKELDCDFYFGDDVGTPIKEMDVTKLKGYKKTLKRKSYTKWKYFWLSGSLKPIFKPYKYYIISGGSKYLSCWLLLLVAKLTGKKVLSWAHGIRGDKSKMQIKIDVIYYKLCHKVLLYGHYPKEKMISLGIAASKLKVIYNSLDYEKQLQFRASPESQDIYKTHFKNNNPVILYIGRLQKSKKLEVLLHLKEKLAQANTNVNLVFIGKDIGDNDLATKVAASNSQKEVWFYGPCYDESTIATLIQQSNLCISPGPIGLTAIHVATYGVPIITNDNFQKQMPEFEVITDGENGTFYKDGDLESLFLKTKEWLALSKDKKKIVKEYSENRIDQYYNPKYQTQLLNTLTI